MNPLMLNRRQAGALLGAAALPLAVRANTPKDTLVVAAAFDDIISLDPAEAFEISAGELMGNGYDRLLRYDVSDPSKLLPRPGQQVERLAPTARPTASS